METGEPAGPALADDFEITVEPWNLIMEVIEFSFKNTTKASFQNTTIQPPHWTSSGDWWHDWSSWAQHLRMAAAPYSLGPAVYLVDGKQSQPAEVEIKVRVDISENVGGTGKLQGTIGDLTIEAECPTGAGEHTVTGKIVKLPRTISWYHGAMSWSIDVDPPGVCLKLNTTPAEVFFILGKPGRMFKKGVWIEALRFVCGRAGVLGVSSPHEAAARVARYCHTTHGMRYDTVYGGPKFNVGQRGGAFLLTNYLCRFTRIVNCYDQAAAVQTFCGALGVLPTWIFLKPYGFITQTVLVGVGPCNNPFFDGNGSRAIMPPDHPARTDFGNHAFVGLGKILDACAGPHECTEDLDEYIDAAIDHTTSLYRLKGLLPGTIFDAQEGCPGVTDVG